MGLKKSCIRKKFITVGMCVVMCIGSSLEVSAAGVASDGSLFQNAGIGNLLGTTLTDEEYIQVAEDSVGACYGYTNLGIADVESGNLNIRDTPSTSGTLVGKLPKNAACEVISEEDGWAYITSGEVEGYVNTEFLLTGADGVVKARELIRTVARVTEDGVRIRDDASLESAVLTQVPAGEELEFVEDMGDWVKVSIDGEDAYISADYVEIETKLDTAITMTELLYGQGVSDLRVDLVEYAKQFIGNPYVYGGTSLTKGCDCSGFVMSVYAHFGISLSHSSKAQSNEGRQISYSQLQPGDLIFYGNSSGSINHVALYIGGGQVISASSPRTGIKICSYNYRTPVKYVSIIND